MLVRRDADTKVEDAAVPSGTTFAFMRGVAGGALMFEPALFSSGYESLVAAREDGFIPADEELSNDFYIRNRSRRRGACLWGTVLCSVTRVRTTGN